MSGNRNRKSCFIHAVFHQKSVVALAVASTCALAPNAFAQTNELALEEIVITAQRRAEVLSDIPVAGDAFGADELARRGIVRIDDLQQQTPALSIKTFGVTRFVNIRGLGLNASTPSITGGVAQHVDGVFSAGTGLSFGDPFYDLERVEVLRGPQGTFVGQNSTGGALFVVSRNPQLGESDYFVEQTIGSYDWYKTQGAVNLPISDTAAARVAVNIEKRDSFYRNVGTTDPFFGFPINERLAPLTRPGDLDQQAVRLKYLWQPSDALRVVLSHEQYKLRTGGYAQQPIYNFAEFPHELIEEIYNDPYTLGYNTPTRYDQDIKRSYAEINWDINDSMALRSQTSYLQLKVNNIQDIDGSPHPNMEVWYNQGGANPGNTGIPGAPPATDFRRITEQGLWGVQQIGPNEVLTQEFNLLSTGDSSLQWVLGAFYLSNDQQSMQTTNVLEAGPNRQQSTIIDSKGDQQSMSLFGQITYDITPSLQVIAGARYGNDESENPGSSVTIWRPNPQQAAGPPGNFIVLPPSTTITPSGGRSESSETTGKLALNWKVTDAHLLYVNASKGYKAGNFNNQTPGSATNPPPTFKPETVMNYEVGWKVSGSRLRSELTAFKMDYNDFQLAFFDPSSGASPVRNLPKAEVQGIELQLRAQFGGLGFNLSGSVLDTEIKESGLILDNRRLPNQGLGFVPTPTYVFPYQNVAGNELPYAPEYNISLGLDYAFRVGAGRLTPRVQYARNGQQWGTVFQMPSIVPESITATNPAGTPETNPKHIVSPDLIEENYTVDAKLTWEPNDNWLVEVFGTNLTEEVYIAGFAGNNKFYNTPRQYGIRVRFQR